MAKIIPKALRKALVRSLYTSDSPLSTQEISTILNNDLTCRFRTTPKQVAYILNVLQREPPDVIIEIVKALNGRSRHGNTRFRKEFTINRYLSLAEAEDTVGILQKPKGSTTILLSETAMGYVRHWQGEGVSAGQTVTNLITAYMEVNGMPTDEDDPENFANEAKHDLTRVTLHGLPYTVSLFLKEWKRLHSVGAGKVIEDLILTDMEANPIESD